MVTAAQTGLISLNALWRSQPAAEHEFEPQSLAGLPPLARRYLERAIAPGTPLASTVRLGMQGEIKLGPQWYPFRGEEVLCWPRGMIWRATTWMRGLPIWGADRVVDGVGDMQWKMLGLLPVMRASGPEVTRSGIGRWQGEALWLPSALCQPQVTWQDLNKNQVQATFTTLGETAHLTLTLDGEGTVQQVQFDRWGNPDGGDHRYLSFGGYIEASTTFEGYTIPTSLRMGWFFGSDRFESEGEFFRCRILRATYR